MAVGIITRMRKQTAVYWPAPVNDGYGRYSFRTAVEIDCRWEDTIEIFVDKEGKERRSMAKVYTDRDVDMDGYLWLGTTSDSAYLADPQSLTDAYPIRRFDTLPTLAATQFLRTAWL